MLTDTGDTAENFYPRPPGGGRPSQSRYTCRGNQDFYPRPPGGGRQDRVAHRHISGDLISIHALRVEGDGVACCDSQCGPISIHALRVEGDQVAQAVTDTKIISIHALRVEGDLYDTRVPPKRPISIHALRVEGDVEKTIKEGDKDKHISIHALRVEGDAPTAPPEYDEDIFLSTPSGWRATAKTDKVFVCFCAKGRRICLFKTRKEKNLPVAF